MRIFTSIALFLALAFCLYRCMEALNMFPKEANKKIFIIGDSTVRYDYDEERQGWGTALVQSYMKHPENGFNEARRGATAENYKVMSEKIKKSKGAAYWEKTKKLIESTPDSAGGYLLIQFGSNDKTENVPKEIFIQLMRKTSSFRKRM